MLPAGGGCKRTRPRPRRPRRDRGEAGLAVGPTTPSLLVAGATPPTPLAAPGVACAELGRTNQDLADIL